MDSAYYAKLELVKSAVTDASERYPKAREYLFEGVFWLLDLMEQEIVRSGIPKQEYLIAQVQIMKAESSRCTKDMTVVFDAFTIGQAYSRLRMFGPDHPEGPPQSE